jgi:hypothetical protein
MSRPKRTRAPSGADKPRRPASPLRLVAGRLAADSATGERDNDDSGWLTLGTFVIEFQQRQAGRGTQQRTLAHHMESAEDSRWQEIVTGALLSWMLGRLIRDSGSER